MSEERYTTIIFPWKPSGRRSEIPCTSRNDNTRSLMEDRNLRKVDTLVRKFWHRERDCGFFVSKYVKENRQLSLPGNHYIFKECTVPSKSITLQRLLLNSGVVSTVDVQLIRDNTKTLHSLLISLFSGRASRTNKHLGADTLLWFTINTTAYSKKHNLPSIYVFNLENVRYNKGFGTQQLKTCPLITTVEQFFLFDYCTSQWASNNM